MTFLSEDPTYLAGSLVLIAGALLMALKVTQQGKYLVWALTVLGLALVVVVVEQVWVTDNERIERTVYELRRAVLAADPDQVLAQLTPDVEYVQDGISLSGNATRELIRGHLTSTAFDFVHIQDLQTSAGRQTRRGRAEFRVYAKGTFRTPLVTYNMGTASSTWSLGFQETEPGVWKVDRITPVSAPDVTVWLPKSQGSSRSVARGPGGMNPRGPESLGSSRLRSSSGRYRGRPSPPDSLPDNRAEAPR